MGMGCKGCEKPKVSYRKGLWSPEEDERLRDYIIRHGHGCWSAVPIKAGELHTCVFFVCIKLIVPQLHKIQ